MDIVRLIRYDQWATLQALEQVCQLSQAQFHQEFAGPFSSVRQQAAHMVLVPDRYRARLMGEPAPDIPVEQFETSQQIVEHHYEVAARYEDLIEALTPQRLAETITHETRIGPFYLTVEETLMQVTNHGTFHRGQIALLLKLHGIDPTNTDFILWPVLNASKPG